MNGKLVLLFTIASAIQLGSGSYLISRDDNPILLGSEKCTYGPTYWCHNITQAKSCNAVSHCIKKVWEAEVLPQDNDDVCTVCKDMVKQARDQLLSNMTQSELREVLEGSCKLLPLEIISKECISLMDNFIPELVDALVSRMDPQVVCSISGLCNSIRIDEMLLEMKPIKNKLTCPRCNYYMNLTFSNLKSEEKENLKTSLLNSCGYLSSYSDSCRVAVLEEFEGIYSQLTVSDSKEFCQLFGICRDEKAVSIYQPGNDDLPCDFCKQLANKARDWLVDNNTREEVEKIFQGLCRKCPEKDQCLAFYNKYGDDIYQLLIDDFDAEEFCNRIGICRDGKVLEGPMWTMLIPSKLEKVRDEEMVGNEVILSVECEFCEYVVGQVQSYISDPKTEVEIQELVDHLCDKYLPKEMSSQCDQFVKNYGNELIVLISQQVDPKQICPLLELCPSGKEVKVSDFLPTCTLCEFTVTKLINLIGRNRTKASIESATEKVCKMLPHRYLSGCESFMKNYGDQVIEMILIEGSSKEVCTALHLCLFLEQTQVETEEKVDKVDVGDDPKCVMCEYVISTLAEKIKDNATEAEIKEEVEKVCLYLPRTVRKNCQNFIEMYGDLLISYLAQQMQPQQICTELKLCSNQIENVTGCELCKLSCDYLSKKPEDEAIAVAKGKFCPLLTNVKQECSEMLEDYGPYMLTLLNENVDKEQVCKDIQLC